MRYWFKNSNFTIFLVILLCVCLLLSLLSFKTSKNRFSPRLSLQELRLEDTLEAEEHRRDPFSDLLRWAVVPALYTTWWHAVAKRNYSSVQHSSLDVWSIYHLSSVYVVNKLHWKISPASSLCQNLYVYSVKSTSLGIYYSIEIHKWKCILYHYTLGSMWQLLYYIYVTDHKESPNFSAAT